MTNPNSLPEPESSEPDLSRQIFDYFVEQHSKDPNYMHDLSVRLWSELAPADRDIQTATMAQFYPDDLIGRQNAVRAQLVIDYIHREIEVAGVLNASIIPKQSSQSPEVIATDELDGPSAA